MLLKRYKYQQSITFENSNLLKIRRLFCRPIRSNIPCEIGGSNTNNKKEEITLEQIMEKLNQTEQDMKLFKDETRNRLSEIESKIGGASFTAEEKDWLLYQTQLLSTDLRDLRYHVQDLQDMDPSQHVVGMVKNLEVRVNKIEASEMGQKFLNSVKDVQSKFKDFKKKVNEITNKTNNTSNNTKGQIKNIQNQVKQFDELTHKNAQKLSSLQDKIKSLKQQKNSTIKKSNFNTQNYYEILLDNWQEITDEEGDEYLELIFKVFSDDYDELQIWAPIDFYSDQLQNILQEDNNSDKEFYEKIQGVLCMLGIEVTMGVINVNDFKNDSIQLEISFQNGEMYVFDSVVSYGLIITEMFEAPLYITKNVAKQFCSG